YKGIQLPLAVMSRLNSADSETISLLSWSDDDRTLGRGVEAREVRSPPDDVFELEDYWERGLEGEIREIVDLTVDEEPQQPPQARVNGSIPPGPRIHLSLYHYQGIDLTVGETVEIRPFPEEDFFIQFLQVHQILRVGREGKVVVRGIPYTRSKNLRGML